MDPTFGYDDLFAYRVMLQDEFENESDIIRELRYELLQRGMPQADIPNFLRNFYQTFEINISLNTINETLDTEQAHQMPFQNGNEFMNLLTGFLNQNFMPPNNVGDTSNNNIPNTNTDTSNNNDASDNEVNVVVEEDNDEDLLEDNDENLENVDQDLVDDDNDYYVPDKNDQSKLIHLDEVILFGTLFGRKKVFESINFKTGFAADADFYEQATKLYLVKKLDLRTYIYHRNIPNSICALIKKANLINN